MRIALVLCLVFSARALAGVEMSLQLTHGYDFYFPSVSLSADSPAPETYHRVESPNGTIWRNSGTNNNSNPFFLTNNLNVLIGECTNGLWKLYLNKESASEAVYYFSISAPDLTTNNFGDIQILFPADGSSGVTNRPTFHWTGPSQLPSLYVSAYDHPGQQNNYWDTPPSTTTNWTPGGSLAAGENEFYISYNDYDFSGITISTPTNALGESLPDWSANGELATYAYSFYTVTGGSGGHVNIAHYDFEDETIYTADLSPAGNDISSSASTGNGATASTTSDSASGDHAVEFDTNGGAGAAWLKPPTNLLSALSGSFSVSLRLKTTQISGNDTDSGLFGNAGIIAAFNGPGNWVVPMALAGSKLAFATGGNPQHTLRSSVPINSGEYVHLVVTRDQNTGVKRIYIDGQQDAQGTGSTDLLDGPQTLDIGYNNGNGFDGLLDDIQFYSGVLSAEEVQFLYENPGSTAPDAGGGNLGEAVEAPELSWTTSGGAPWFSQTSITSDEEDAARSGAIGHDDNSSIETTVTGPGTLSFRWYVSSDDSDGYDALEFYIDDNYQSSISGDYMDWYYEEYELEAGDHTLRWDYYKDSDYSAGEDAGFLDQVVFTPAQGPQNIVHPFNQTNTPGYKVALLAEATGSPDPSWQWYKVGFGLISGANDALYIPANSGTPDVAGQYFAVAFNDAGSANTHTANVTFVSAPLPPDWTRAFKSPSTNGDKVPDEYYLGCHLDSAGDLYTVGSFTGTNTIGTNTYISRDGAFSSVIVKQTDTGAALWSLAVTNNGMGSSFTRLIAPAPDDGIYISGTIFGTNWLGTNLLLSTASSSLYLARLNADGEVLWIKTIVGTNSLFTSYQQMVSDSSGNLTLSALFQGTVDLGTTNLSGTNQYGVLVQYDADGALRWVQRPSGWINALTYHAGRLYGSMPNNDGMAFIGSLTNTTDRKWTLAALDANTGAPIWLRGIAGMSGEGNPSGLSDDIPQVAAAGNDVFVVGNAWGSGASFGPHTVSWNGENGQYFARYDLDGTPQVATSFGSETVFPWVAIADAAGNVYLGADFENFAAFGNNLLAAPHRDAAFSGDYSHSFVAKFDRNGTPLWARQAEAETHFAAVRDLAVAEDGVWFCGIVKSPTAFGTNTVYSASRVVGSPFGFIVWHSSGALAKITDAIIALPQPLTLLNPLRTGSLLQFQFQSQNGLSHTIESRTNLSLGTWQTRSNLTGDGTLKTLQFPATNGTPEFFRVKTE